MTRRFNGLVVWVTGGGSGIGRALALELASRGATVVVSGRRGDRLNEVVEAMQGGSALAVDVTDEAAMREAVRTIVQRHGKLDSVVANAGFGVAGPFDQVDAAMWRRQMDINVVGVAITLRESLPELKKVNGRAVVVSSMLGRIALAGSAPYCASKFALIGLCDALYQELHGTGVTISCILPGVVDSDFARVDNTGAFHADAIDRRPKRLMWPAERAAHVMADAIHRRDREYTFTWHGKVGAFLGQHFPGLVYPVMARLGVRGRG